MLSACWLIGAYFLAVSSHKHGRLNTSVYVYGTPTIKLSCQWGLKSSKRSETAANSSSRSGLNLCSIAKWARDLT